MKEKIKMDQVFEEKGIKVENIILFGLRARVDYRALSDENSFGRCRNGR